MKNADQKRAPAWACLSTRFCSRLRAPDLEFGKYRAPAVPPAHGKGSVGDDGGISSVPGQVLVAPASMAAAVSKWCAGSAKATGQRAVRNASNGFPAPATGATPILNRTASL